MARFAGLFDAWLEFPGFPGIPERPAAVRDLPGFLRRVQEQPFDLALQMQGNGSVINPFTVLLGARAAAGFYVPGQYCPDPELYLPYPEHEPEIHRNLRLMEFLGLPVDDDTLDFPLSGEDRVALAEALGGRELVPGRYICIHPGAQDPNRRWTPESFAIVADNLAAQDWQIVLTGSVAEAGLVAEVAHAMHAPALDLAGQTNLGALASLLLGARLLVCNDTGVSHLAAALRTPSVVIFITSNPVRWAPLDRRRHRAVQGVPAIAGANEAFEAASRWHQDWTVDFKSQFASTPTILTPDSVLSQAQELLRDPALVSPAAPAAPREAVYAA
jgi:ADP-heptose:LPS heptosyltransferase